MTSRMIKMIMQWIKHHMHWWDQKETRDHVIRVTNNQRPSDVRQTSSILGKSRFPGSKMVAARDIRKKSIFCIDNLNTSCTVGDITEFVTNELSIEVLNCFEAKPRRRRGDNDFAFHLYKACCDSAPWPAVLPSSPSRCHWKKLYNKNKVWIY